MRWGSCAGEGWVGGPWGGTLGVTQALGECAVGGWVLPARQTMRACFQDELLVIKETGDYVSPCSHRTHIHGS